MSTLTLSQRHDTQSITVPETLCKTKKHIGRVSAGRQYKHARRLVVHVIVNILHAMIDYCSSKNVTNIGKCVKNFN